MSTEAVPSIKTPSGFQRGTLAVIVRDGPLYGLAIKRAMEDLYEKDVNHGQLYPNLDTLVEQVWSRDTQEAMESTRSTRSPSTPSISSRSAS
ncbi:helix-turn-helix transcriptional regulator [Haladaptatus sp. CMAA 1911]|uniref:helix-turn-helix transcriptional regulator n=1 Tax=unclassified Haladaptatus TaxID=2622732 RepID=UPI0037541499